jgi:hypothetical protein
LLWSSKAEAMTIRYSKPGLKPARHWTASMTWFGADRLTSDR